MSSLRLRAFGRALKNQSQSSKATSSNPETEEWVDEGRQRGRRGQALLLSRPAAHASAHKKKKGTTSAASRGESRDTTHHASAHIQATRTEAVDGASHAARNVSAHISTPLNYTLSLLTDVLSGLYFASDTTLRVLVAFMGFFRLPFAIVACPPILSTTILLAILSLLASILFHNVAILFTGLAAHLESGLGTACAIRGLSSMPICHWVNTYPLPTARGVKGKDVVYWADYPSLMEVQSRTFEQVLDKSVTRSTTPSSLSLDLKKAEVATADLIVLIRLSSLRSRDGLGDTLDEFLSGARSAGRALACLDAKMNGALDNIMAMNNYVMRSIEEAKANELPVHRLLKSFTPRIFGKATEDVVKETFLDSMHVLSGHLEAIILEVEGNIHTLDLLEEKLNTLRSIIARDDAVVAAGRDELLSYLWTKLGGNRKDLKNFDRNLKLLAELGRCRQAAQARVVGALHALHRVSQDMEDMRDRVAAPNLAGSGVTPEVHMQSIVNGMERLAWGWKRARRIEDELLRRALDAPSPLDGTEDAGPHSAS